MPHSHSVRLLVEPVSLKLWNSSTNKEEPAKSSPLLSSYCLSTWLLPHQRKLATLFHIIHWNTKIVWIMSNCTASSWLFNIHFVNCLNKRPRIPWMVVEYTFYVPWKEMASKTCLQLSNNDFYTMSLIFPHYLKVYTMFSCTIQSSHWKVFTCDKIRRKIMRCFYTDDVYLYIS